MEAERKAREQAAQEEAQDKAQQAAAQEKLSQAAPQVNEPVMVNDESQFNQQTESASTFTKPVPAAVSEKGAQSTTIENVTLKKWESFDTAR